MKGWTRRRVALILALAIVASQMAGCKDNGGAVQSSVPAANENAVVTEAVEIPAEEATEPVSADGWLEENLDNIRQSLLEGDYAQVIDILLGMQDELVNDPDFNALLYIAYMGNGNESDAAALLDNPNLDDGAFTDSFLENAEALEGNEDIEAIKRKLMEHMLGLGESDPEAYAAVARIGAIVSNDDPSDPTAYAARYIAALAVGDEAAMEAILEEAKANGVTAEELCTTTAEYIERVNLTTISVEEAEEGIMTSTTYNAQGNVVKSEVIVDNEDGTYTKYVENSDGQIVGEALFDKATGEPITRTFYVFDRMIDDATGNVIEVNTGAKEVYDYKDGVIDSITAYLADGSMNYQVQTNGKGEIIRAYDYSSGEQKEFSGEVLNILHFDVVDGDLISKTVPVVDNEGTVVGKLETRYNYDNPVGLVAGWTDYVGNKKLQEVDIEYTFDDEAKAEKKAIQQALYDDINGEKATSRFEYEHEECTAQTTIQSLYLYGSYIDYYGAKIDYKNHTWVEQDLYGMVTGAPCTILSSLDETNRYTLTQEVYNENNILSERRYAYYTGKELTSELDVYYDEQGRVIGEKLFGEDRAIDPYNPKKEIVYTYDDNGNIAQAYEATYDVIGLWEVEKTTTYEYDANGRRISETTEETNWETFDITTSKKNHYYDENGKIIKTENYEVDWLGDVKLIDAEEYEYLYNEDGTEKQRVIKNVKDGVTVTTGEINYSYAEDGSRIVEAKDLLTNTSEVAKYSYDKNGVLNGYTITDYDAEGNEGETVYYTAEGYVYQIAVYENGVLMMYRVENGELIPEESIPEESIPEESIPEESIPEESIPEESIPEESIPEESIPEESIPEESIPEESIPEESIPEETTAETTAE